VEDSLRKKHSNSVEPKPFNESIVGLIRDIGEDNGWLSRTPAPSVQLCILAMVILKTEVLSGHDEIIAAWKDQCRMYWLDDEYGVVANLRAKKAAAKKAPGRKQGNKQPTRQKA